MRRPVTRFAVFTLCLLFAGSITRNGRCTRTNHSKNSGTWQIDGQFSTTTLPGIRVARFSFIHTNPGAGDDSPKMTVAASLSLMPLLGVNIAKRLTARSTHSRRALLPALLGAYLGSVVTGLTLTLFSRLDERVNAISSVDDFYFISAGRHAAAVDLLRQLILPALIPGMSAVAGWGVGRIHPPVRTKITFLRPTMLPSPTRENQLLLGIQIINGTF